MLRIQQFAKIANVTVRTLHHYDRLGLLSPTLRSARGYRLYRIEDLARLERILVLRYMGLPLREIATLLATGEASQNKNLPGDSPGNSPLADSPETTPALAETLTRQASILRARRNGIDRVLNAIEHASRQLKRDQKPDWSLYQTILKEIHMQENQDWTSKYYSGEAKQAVEERKTLWNPEMQAKVTADWQQLYADVQSAIDRSIAPSSGEGQALSARWAKLVEGFTGGNPAIQQGLNKLYADRPNWPTSEIPEEARKNMPKPELMAFIRAAQDKA